MEQGCAPRSSTRNIHPQGQARTLDAPRSGIISPCGLGAELPLPEETERQDLQGRPAGPYASVQVGDGQSCGRDTGESGRPRCKIVMIVDCSFAQRS